MRFRSFILTAAILIGGVSAYAKLIPIRPFFLDRGITLNGVEIPPGMYTLSLETQGSSVVASLWREDKFIANARGTWVKHGVKYTQNAALLRINSDGTRSLVEIRLAGLAKTIMFDDVTEVLRAAPGQDHTVINDSNRVPIGN
jgi:hypothetical protein